jgi:hypothetical protein
VNRSDETARDYGFPSTTQNLVVAYTSAPRLVQNLEYDEVVYAHSGLAISHPFLDRRVVEYVASIPVEIRPYDGRTKILARKGFADALPPSVLNRRSVTLADSYLDVIVAQHATELRARYPVVPTAAEPFIDQVRYAAEMDAIAATTPEYGNGSLWRAWMLMIWLDRLHDRGAASVKHFQP